MDKFVELPSSSNEKKFDSFKFLLILTEIVGIILIILIIIWTIHFRGGFTLTLDLNHLFNWHPLLMTIGLVFSYANGTLIYRWQKSIRKRRLKIIHGGIMIFALLLTLIGLICVFITHNLKIPPIPNLYTLHSWVGMTSIFLFICQWITGFVTFFYPGMHPQLRTAYLPIHIYFGIAGFIGVIASCLIGLNEKAIFALNLQKNPGLVPEGIFMNIIGLFFIIFGGSTVYLLSQERYKRKPKEEDNTLLTGSD